MALSFDGQSPSFIPTNPALPPNTVAPLDFVKEENRFFPEGGNETELSTEGHVIRGRKFNIQGQALVALHYPACWLGFPPLPQAPQPVAKEIVGAGNNQKQKFTLKSTPIEFLGTRYRAPAGDGFDDATYFASQHLPGGTPGQTRPMKLLHEGDGDSITLSKTSGSFVLSGSTDDGSESNFSLQANTAALEVDGEVDESVTHRKLKVVSLPPQHWTVGVYRVHITELDGTTRHEGPNPPTQAAINEVLNNTFEKQANVTFAAGVVQDIELKLAELATPVTYPPWVSDISDALKARVTENPQPDLMLFWIPDFKPYYFGGQAFATPSRGAVIRGGQSDRKVAHEIGHCLGLYHCWASNSIASQMNVPDTEDKRLMGYRGGFLLCSQEIITVNQWRP